MIRRYSKNGPRILRPGKRLARGLREAAFDQDMCEMRDDLLAALADSPSTEARPDNRTARQDVRQGGAV